MKKNKGFTLIELVVVIVILGILAVTAAPKFLNLQGDARHAALEGLKGAIEGAMGISYGKAAVDGVESSPLSSISSASNNVSIQFGYPTATSGGVIAAIENMQKGDDWSYSNNLESEKKSPRRLQQLNSTNATKIVYPSGMNATMKDYYKKMIDRIDKLKSDDLKSNIKSNITVGLKPYTHGNFHCWITHNGVSNLHVSLLNKGMCGELNKYAQQPVTPGGDSDGSGSIDSKLGMIITFEQYKNVVNTPAQIPKKCYLKYIPAQNANTPAKVELLPNACLTD